MHSSLVSSLRQSANLMSCSLYPCHIRLLSVTLFLRLMLHSCPHKHLHLFSKHPLSGPKQPLGVSQAGLSYPMVTLDLSSINILQDFNPICLDLECAHSHLSSSCCSSFPGVSLRSLRCNLCQDKGISNFRVQFFHHICRAMLVHRQPLRHKGRACTLALQARAEACNRPTSSSLDPAAPPLARSAPCLVRILKTPCPIS